MASFFHGWRRKAGVFTLVLALAFMGLWLRTFRMRDVLTFGNGTRSNQLFSIDGRIVWVDNGEPRPKRCTLYSVRDGRASQAWNVLDVEEVMTSSDPMEFTSAHQGGALYALRQTSVWSIHYGVVVLPLTLLAAYLLLIPSRKRPPTASQPDA